MLNKILPATVVVLLLAAFYFCFHQMSGVTLAYFLEPQPTPIPMSSLSDSTESYWIQPVGAEVDLLHCQVFQDQDSNRKFLVAPLHPAGVHQTRSRLLLRSRSDRWFEALGRMRSCSPEEKQKYRFVPLGDTSGVWSKPLVQPQWSEGMEVAEDYFILEDGRPDGVVAYSSLALLFLGGVTAGLFLRDFLKRYSGSGSGPE